MELHHEPDGVGLAVEEALRAGVAGATALGRHLAQKRIEAHRSATQAGREQEAEYKARLTVEKSAMRAKLAVTKEGAWWRRTNGSEILDAWTLANEWKALDPDAATAAARIRDEVHERYGLDLADVDGNEGAGGHDDLALPEGTPDHMADALRSYRAARRVVDDPGQGTVDDVAAAGGPSRPPRARKSRGRRGTGARKTERSR